MLSSSSDLARSSLRITHDGEFYRMLLSRDISSAAVPSFRGWDATNCAVPFKWESCPGTPKHSGCQAEALPPLTPPPSYQSSPRRSGTAGKHPSKAGLLRAVLPWLARRKPRVPTSSMQASPDGSCGHHTRSRLPSPRSSPCASSMEDDNDSDVGWQTRQTPCFGTRHGSLRGCCSVVIRKNVFHLPWM